MTVLERIKETARTKKNISLTVLEQDLGYSNGSLAKAKDIPSSRILEISDYLNVSMNYLMTGKEREFTVEMADMDTEVTMLEKRIKEYAIKLSKLSEDDRKDIMKMIDRLGK